MKNLNTYIIEKLHIKNGMKSDIDKMPTDEEFFDALEKCGEVELSLIFDKDNIPYDEKNRDILSIYIEDDTMMYSFRDPSVSYDCESKLTLDMFTDEDLKKIYSYLLSF